MRLFKSSNFRLLVVTLLFAAINLNCFAQEQYKENKKITAIEEYKGGAFYPVQQYEQVDTKKNPKVNNKINLVLLFISI